MPFRLRLTAWRTEGYHHLTVGFACAYGARSPTSLIIPAMAQCHFSGSHAPFFFELATTVSMKSISRTPSSIVGNIDT